MGKKPHTINEIKKPLIMNRGIETTSEAACNSGIY